MKSLLKFDQNVISVLSDEEMLLVVGGDETVEDPANNAGGICQGSNNSSGTCTGANNGSGSCKSPNNGSGKCGSNVNNGNGVCKFTGIGGVVVGP